MKLFLQYNNIFLLYSKYITNKLLNSQMGMISNLKSLTVISLMARSLSCYLSISQDQKSFSYNRFPMGFPGGSVVENLPAVQELQETWIQFLAHGNLLRYSCLENSMDRGTWWAIFHRVTKSKSLNPRQVL